MARFNYIAGIALSFITSNSTFADNRNLRPNVYDVAMARLISSYVLAQLPNDNVVYEQTNGGVRARIKIKGGIFVVDAVPNNSRSRNLGSLSIKFNPDDGTSYEYREFIVIDNNLDARCDFAYLIQSSGEKFIYDRSRGVGIETKDQFKKLYLDSLDEVVRVYN
ncbi:hypothetical protein HYU23_04270 [Candidatus Woesearchaeota archaeon]|nr:hypothetical protein [Candidatus Woesearchaeota archaeon]